MNLMFGNNFTLATFGAFIHVDEVLSPAENFAPLSKVSMFIFVESENHLRWIGSLKVV